MGEFDSLPLFAGARNTDPETSQALRNAFVVKHSQRDLILKTYYSHYLDNLLCYDDGSDGDQGLTDEEAGMNTPFNGSNMFEQRVCYWKRCSELRKLGYIEPTGKTRVSSAGMQQQVCAITVEGRRFVSDKL